VRGLRTDTIYGRFTADKRRTKPHLQSFFCEIRQAASAMRVKSQKQEKHDIRCSSTSVTVLCLLLNLGFRRIEGVQS